MTKDGSAIRVQDSSCGGGPTRRLPPLIWGSATRRESPFSPQPALGDNQHSPPQLWWCGGAYFAGVASATERVIAVRSSVR